MNRFNNNNVKRETDLYLSTLVDKTNDDLYVVNDFALAANIINNSSNPKEVLCLLNSYYKTGILSPLTLYKNEFNKDRVNIRVPSIKINIHNEIIYENAWQPDIVHAYDNEKLKEIGVFPTYINIEHQYPIYITKGGCCTGEYISEVTLKQSTVDKHCFMPHNPIKIPMSIIVYGDGSYNLYVDAREPKLKSLEAFYNVYINKCSNKVDIRKFKKFKNNGKNKR